jgi:3-oxoacyl-[acyl-carrier-protein] synthase II
VSRASIVAAAALSPLGRGVDAYDPGRATEPGRVVIARDEELAAFGLVRPFTARAPLAMGLVPGRADALLEAAWTDLRTELLPLPTVGASAGLKLGLVVGTSSGGMPEAEHVFEAGLRATPIDAAIAAGATYAAPFERLVGLIERDLGVALARKLQLVTACAASTWALGVGLRWLRSGSCDLVLAGGYDALSRFVGAGFECLRATTASLPRPFRLERDGMSLGEGAALVAMVREGEEGSRSARFVVSGFGATTDAVHVTAPDRSGEGLARAARSALADAEVDPRDCVLLSAHATATPFNDAMEARAIHGALGRQARPVVHPMKAQLGHTLGAAGVLETLAIAEALARDLAPAAAGQGQIDPDAEVRLLERAAPLEAGEAAFALKLSAAFGGANAALVLERRSSPPHTSRARHAALARVVRWARIDTVDVAEVAERSGAPLDRVARLDDASLLLAGAVARLGTRRELEGAGVVVGHLLATIDVNERFYRKVLERGPAAAEPRLFPPTSPNVVAGQVAILFGLRGPSAAVASGAGGALDALWLGLELVEAGDAQAVVVGALDVDGTASRSLWPFVGGGLTAPPRGAVAAWIERADGAAPSSAELRARLGSIATTQLGHLALAEALERLG